MPKRPVELDDGLLAAAQDALNTSGVTDTVRVSLRHAVAAAARARQADWLAQGGLLELTDEDDRDAVWH